ARGGARDEIEDLVDEQERWAMGQEILGTHEHQLYVRPVGPARTHPEPGCPRPPPVSVFERFVGDLSRSASVLTNIGVFFKNFTRNCTSRSRRVLLSPLTVCPRSEGGTHALRSSALNRK